MIWRVIIFWLLGTALAVANFPRPFTTPATVALRYDAENQLTNVFETNTWRVGYVYDGFGLRRIRRAYGWQSGTWTLTNEIHYIYDGPLVIQERDANNNVLVTYTRGLDLSGSLRGAGGMGGLLARRDTNGTTYYHCDGSGNITALTDANGNVVARYEYDAFGRLIGKWGSMADVNVYRFSSKEYDAVIGLYYFGGRYYDPVLQRWLNRDPIQERGGINLYQFARNNPLRHYDSFGLQVGVGVGGVEGVPEREFDVETRQEEVFGEGESTPTPEQLAWNEDENLLQELAQAEVAAAQAYRGPESQLSDVNAPPLVVTGQCSAAEETTALSTYRMTTEGETFYHYGNAENAASFEGGLRPGGFATSAGDLSGTEAQSGLALPQATPPNAVYTVTPQPGTWVRVNPVTTPQFGQPGGLSEFQFPGGTGPGTVSLPTPILPR
jgi:RHS repeat-associated protein